MSVNMDKKKQAGTDLFTWLDALWNKKRPPGMPPIYIMHRFLASEQTLAHAARFLQSDLRREPDLVMGTWQALLPQQQRAPRLAYVVAKKPPEAEELTQKMMEVLGERREVVEEMQALVTITLADYGRLKEEVYFYYGVEPPEAETTGELWDKERPKPRGGLLDL